MAHLSDDDAVAKMGDPNLDVGHPASEGLDCGGGVDQNNDTNPQSIATTMLDECFALESPDYGLPVNEVTNCEKDVVPLVVLLVA